MSDSILTSVKKSLGLAEDYVAFDSDVTMFINAALSTLNQLGIGPPEGFSITDKTVTWTDFLTEDHKKFNNVQQYVYLKVKIIFDPPANYHAAAAIEKLITELEWRLNVTRETTDWVNPDPVVFERHELLPVLGEDPYDPGFYIIEQP